MLTRQIIDTRRPRGPRSRTRPWGDLTSELLIPGGGNATARLVAREPGVFSGGAVFAAAMTLTDPAHHASTLHVADGDALRGRATRSRPCQGPARVGAAGASASPSTSCSG